MVYAQEAVIPRSYLVFPKNNSCLIRLIPSRLVMFLGRQIKEIFFLISYFKIIFTFTEPLQR